jgi:RNA polymerase sigma-70 factor, ECF subfamily
LKDSFEVILEQRRRFEHESHSLRPDLHRFCTRMTGSVSDGEDAVQETLVHAFYHLPELRDGGSFRSWLFRIAHNRCVDLLRRRRALLPLDDEQAPAGDLPSELEQQQLAQQALAIIFTRLPSRERAAIVLSDVLGYSLEEAAEITSSNAGAVKSAVYRARQRLTQAMSVRIRPHALEQVPLLQRYVDCFNGRDWAGVRELLAHDARLEVVERTAGPFEGQRYFENYTKLAHGWQLGLALVEGTPAIVFSREIDGQWHPRSLVYLELQGGRVSLVRDYYHIDYLLTGARVQPLDG